MKTYAYTGQDTMGNQAGRIDASSARAAAEALAQQGIVPFEIVEVKPKPSRSSWLSMGSSKPFSQSAGADPKSNALASKSKPRAMDAFVINFGRPKVAVADVIMFARQMHVLMKAGVPILSGLASIRDTNPSPGMKAVLEDVIEQLESGKDLSSCLGAHPRVFDEFFISMIRVGEETGKLDDVFWTLYERMEFDEQMQRQIKMATRYPMFVMTAIAIALGVVNLFVIPSFAKVFEGFGAQLPFLTRVLLWTSKFAQNQLPAIAVALILGVVVFRAWTKMESGKLAWHGALLKAPFFGSIVLKASLARFCRGMALSLSSGVPVLQAISIVAKTSDNAMLAKKLSGMRASIERGLSVFDAAQETTVFPPMVLQMIAVGDQSGKLDEMMNEVASSYTKDVKYELQTFSQRLEPLLIAVMGVFVLILALGIFLPIWDLGNVALHKK